MKKILYGVITVVMVATMTLPTNVASAATIAQNMKGRILLQVEKNGEAWYVHPQTTQRHYLGRPADAYRIMRSQGLGITNADLSKIPVAGESRIGDRILVNRLKGKILLQVQEHGEAWYVNPVDGKRYFLGTPDAAYSVLRKAGLGISNADIEKIAVTTERISCGEDIDCFARAMQNGVSATAYINESDNLEPEAEGSYSIKIPMTYDGTDAAGNQRLYVKFEDFNLYLGQGVADALIDAAFGTSAVDGSLGLGAPLTDEQIAIYKQIAQLIIDMIMEMTQEMKVMLLGRLMTCTYTADDVSHLSTYRPGSELSQIGIDSPGAQYMFGILASLEDENCEIEGIDDAAKAAFEERMKVIEDRYQARAEALLEKLMPPAEPLSE